MSLFDFYKQKLAPIGQKLSGMIDQDQSMSGIQLAKGGLLNQLNQRGIIGVGGQSLAPVQVRPAQQFVSGALRPVADAVGTFGKLSFDAIVKQPARNRQMQLDTQKAIDASNRALQTAKMTREAGRPDLAAQMTRSMIPQLQSESQRFQDITNQTQSKQKALVGSGVRTGLYASALAAPVASLGAGALSTGLGAAFAGQTSPEQLGTSFGEGFKYGGMPNPVVKGGLLAKSAVGGLVNLAEDALYAKTVENRNLSPKEIALSLALPAAFETMGALNKAIKVKPKVDVTTTPEGLTYNKKGQLFDPISGQFAKSTEEARIAVQHVKDFIQSGGKPVRSQTRLIETAPNKWVDEQDLQNFNSTIDTPKLAVEPTTPIRRPLKEVYGEKFSGPTTQEAPRLTKEVQTPSTQIEAPKPVVSSDSIITPAGNLPKRSGQLKQQLMEAQQGLEQSQVIAEQNKLIRDNFSNDQIKDINKLKLVAKKSLDQGGDIETLRAKYPKLVESVTSSVREADQTIIGDSEAIDFALSLPTKAETKVNMTEVKQLQKQLDPITKLDEAGIAATTGDKSITSAIAEPTIKTVKKISTKQQKLDTANEVRARKKLDDEWQKAVFGEAQTRTVKQAEKELDQAIKRSTNEASFKMDTADGWKDKSALSLGTETMDRNFEDVMGKNAPELKRKLLEPVYKKEAERTRFLNTEREQIKQLGIKAGSKESSLVQEYGEGNITREQLSQQTNNPEKIIKASEFIRGKYDEYLGQLNKVLTRNGYEPIPKRQDYFHHFQELSGAFDLLGVSLKAQDLPTDINGLTADFKPGKTFFSAALQRLGGDYKSDAIGGIDKYLEGASNQIYHTDNIQALRSFETALREKYAGTNHLSNFVANLSEYTNGIAGKKSMIDRAAESIVGRGIYGAATGLKRQVGANMVGANVSSALTNFIPLTQTLATTDKGSVLNAIMATIKNVGKDDGFIQASDFLTTRNGTDRLAKSLYENVADKAGWLFKNVDSFVSQVVTRSKYLEGIKKGMSESSAMDYANSWAKKLMAGRGKGEMPTLFNSQTLGAITQFQLEVKNQLSFMAKDIPRNFDKVGATSAIAQLFLYGYLFNNIYEKVTGRRPAFDPIGVGQRTYEDYTNPDMKKGQATKNLVGNVSDQLPFVSTFTGGRLPITSAIPNPMAVVNGESTLKKELMKPLQFVLPTGGGQIKKSYEGIKAYNQGASTSPSGRVRYTIPQTPANRVRTALFGQWSTPEAQKYLREGQTPLGYNQSKIVLESNDKQTLFDKIKSRQLSDKQLAAVKDTLKSGNTKSAAVTTGKYVYFDEKTGDVNTLDLSKVTSMPETTNYETVKKDKARWTLADDILKLDPTDQVEAFKQLGISKDDAEYYTVAKDATEAKAAYIKDQVQGVKNYDEFLQKVAPLTKEVNGQKILSSGVVDWMYNNDIITSAQKKQLKSLEFKGGKVGTKASTAKGKIKKITVKPLSKFNLAGKVKKVKRIRTNQYKLKI
jgi:hypothetical protein